MDIVSCAKNILTGCMDVKPEENVLIVTDDNKLAIGQAFYEAAKELGWRGAAHDDEGEELFGAGTAGTGGRCDAERRRGGAARRQNP